MRGLLERKLLPFTLSWSSMGGYLDLNRSGDHGDKTRQAEVVGPPHCPRLRLSWRVISRRQLWLRGFKSSKRRRGKHRFIDLQVGFTWGKLRGPKEQRPPGGSGRSRWW